MSPGREDVESLGERCLREVLVGFVVIVVVVEDILIAIDTEATLTKYHPICFKIYLIFMFSLS